MADDGNHNRKRKLPEQKQDAPALKRRETDLPNDAEFAHAMSSKQKNDDQSNNGNLFSSFSLKSPTLSIPSDPFEAEDPDDAAFEDDFGDGNDPDFDIGDGAWDEEPDEEKGSDDWNEQLMLPELVPQRSSVVLDMSTDDIHKAIQSKVSALAEELNLGERKCLLLLRKYKWDTSKIIDVYFTDPEKILVGAGVCITPKTDVFNDSDKCKDFECGVCFENIPMEKALYLECGHFNTCKDCWIRYLMNAVQSKSCVTLRCPSYKCHVAIAEDVWKKLLGPKHQNGLDRYIRFCRDSFVEVTSSVSIQCMRPTLYVF